jgi:hypothetical protein
VQKTRRLQNEKIGKGFINIKNIHPSLKAGLARSVMSQRAQRTNENRSANLQLLNELGCRFGIVVISLSVAVLVGTALSMKFLRSVEAE